MVVMAVMAVMVMMMAVGVMVVAVGVDGGGSKGVMVVGGCG